MDVDLKKLPVPLELFSCKHCSDEYSLPADHLFWSERQQAWVCVDCWDNDEPYGPALCDVLAERNKDSRKLAEQVEQLRRSVSDYRQALHEIGCALDHEDYSGAMAAVNAARAATATCHSPSGTAEQVEALREALAEIRIRLRNGEPYCTILDDMASAALAATARKGV